MRISVALHVCRTGLFYLFSLLIFESVLTDVELESLLTCLSACQYIRGFLLLVKAINN